MSLPFAVPRLKCSAAPRTGKARLERDPHSAPASVGTASHPLQIWITSAQKAKESLKNAKFVKVAQVAKTGREQLRKVCGQLLAALIGAERCQTGTKKGVNVSSRDHVRGPRESSPAERERYTPGPGSNESTHLGQFRLREPRAPGLKTCEVAVPDLRCSGRPH